MPEHRTAEKIWLFADASPDAPALLRSEAGPGFAPSKLNYTPSVLDRRTADLVSTAADVVSTTADLDCTSSCPEQPQSHSSPDASDLFAESPVLARIDSAAEAEPAVADCRWRVVELEFGHSERATPDPFLATPHSVQAAAHLDQSTGNPDHDTSATVSRAPGAYS